MRTWADARAAQYGWMDGMLALREEAADASHKGQTDAEIAAALNALTVSRRVSVKTSNVLSILLKTGSWGPLVLVARRDPSGDAEQDALTAAAITAVASVERTADFGTDRDEDAAVVEAMIRGFVTAGIFSQAVADRLLALMTVDEPVWLPPVTADDVALARRLKDG